MQKSFDVSGPLTLALRVPIGEITIDATLADRAEVELIAHDEDSQALVDAATIELRGNDLVVEVPHKTRGGFNFGFFFDRGGITCRVRCPGGSNLELRSKSADLAVRGPLGNVSVNTASGESSLQVVGGNLNVKSASGDVRAERVAGNATVQTASGDVLLGAVDGMVSINAVSGDVRVEQAMSDTSSHTVSGDQQHLSVGTGNVTAHSVSGDVAIAVRRGSRVYLDCNTISGDTSSDLDMTGESAADGPLIELRVKTVSGDIRITRAPALTGTPPADSAQEVHA
jgi:hypothetical protein